MTILAVQCNFSTPEKKYSVIKDQYLKCYNFLDCKWTIHLHRNQKETQDITMLYAPGLRLEASTININPIAI